MDGSASSCCCETAGGHRPGRERKRAIAGEGRPDASRLPPIYTSAATLPGLQGGTSMLRRVVHWLSAGLVWMLAVMPLQAHHEILAKFDSAKPRTLNGVVTSVNWVNPHVHVFVNV